MKSRRWYIAGAGVAGASLLALGLAAYGRMGAPVPRNGHSAPGKLEIVRHPAPADWPWKAPERLPRYNPKSTDAFQLDLRSRDARNLDLRGRTADLLHACFDAKTRWPAVLPDDFDPARIMDLNKNPGLGVRALHARGITGRGVAIGIIDQTLLVDHAEYRDRLRLYEEIHLHGGSQAAMHGAAVASIAVGKTVGVAPEADLYFIAETHANLAMGRQFEMDFTWLAESIDRLLEVNATLPTEKRIRVISISVGWSPSQKGYAEANAAVERAKQAGIFVVSSSLERTHGLAFHGLGRSPLSDPDEFAAFGPGSWWGIQFWGNPKARFAPGTRLLVPMDSRTTASPTGADDYVFYAAGGWSWSIPWISGLYALACQVKPEITPDEFWAAALATGRTVPLEHDGTKVEFGTIADPVALIETLQRGARPTGAP